MKRVASLLLSVVMLFSITIGLDLSAFAAESTDSEFEYKIEDDGTARVTKYLGTKTDVTVPAEIDGYTVTGIGNFAFYECGDIVSVTIPDSVEWIGSNVFREIETLTNVNIGKNVSVIGRYVFYGCTSLSSIEIPDSVIRVGECSFVGTAYYNNEDNWVNDVLYIGKFLIEARDTISGDYTIKDGTTIFADNAFDNCADLTGVDIADTVTIIGNNTFYECSGLTSVTMPENLTEIWTRAFSGCSALSSVTFPDSLTEIGGGSFEYCTGLTSVSIPNSVKIIDGEAFNFCSSLSSITLPNNGISIGTNAFNSTAYYNDESNWENDVLYIGKHLVNAKETISGKCTVKDGTLTIAGGAFSYCDNLTGVELPDTIIAIGHAAFFSCDGLTTVNIPKGVTYIGIETFENCIGLTNIVIPDGVERIDIFAFSNCTSLTSITIPSSLKEIVNSVFCGCTSLADVYYTGYESDWNNINIGSNNDCLLNANIHFAPCNHTYNSGVVTKKATCTATGVKTYTCTVCKATKTEPIAKIAHTYKPYNTKATTSKNGSVVTKCSVCGAVKSKSTIYYPKTISLSTTSYTYDGKVKKPSVKVVGSNGKTISSSNYTVSYASGRKNVGKYAVKVTFKGNYSGTKTLYFTIKPKATSISSLTAGSKKFTVKWKKQSTQTTGYQIQYSTSSKFSNAKTVIVSKNSTTSKTISKLSAKKKYYVRVRTYKTVGSTKYYSSWSSAKSVTTKK
ncbi:MAG: leucine-rich repeat protein [Eubacterium sp.]